MYSVNVFYAMDRYMDGWVGEWMRCTDGWVDGFWSTCKWRGRGIRQMENRPTLIWIKNSNDYNYIYFMSVVSKNNTFPVAFSKRKRDSWQFQNWRSKYNYKLTLYAHNSILQCDFSLTLFVYSIFR